MSMQVACPQCGKSAAVPDSAAGRDVRCSCGTVFTIPNANISLQTPPIAPSIDAGKITKCPYCSEEIQATAKKCKHCGEWLNAPPARTVNVQGGMFQQGSTDARAVAKGIKQERAAREKLGCLGASIIFVLWPILMVGSFVFLKFIGLERDPIFFFSALIFSSIVAVVAMFRVRREYYKE